MSKRVRQSKLLVQMLVCICVLMCTFSITVLAGETEDVRFGYTLLEKDGQREIYQALQRAVPDCHGSIDLNCKASKSDLVFAAEMFAADYPEYFWFRGSMQWQPDGGRIVELNPIYEMNGKKVREAKAQLDAVVEEIFDEMPSWINSDVEIAYYLHNVVAERIVYEYGPNHQTAYGGLVEGQAVCAGYARSYQFLLNTAGIDAWYVTGMSYNLDGSERGRHAWNLVWLEDTCVYTDVCWDDPPFALLRYTYYNISQEQMYTDHIPSEMFLDKLPQCGHNELQLSEQYVPSLEVNDTTPYEALLPYAITMETDHYKQVRFQIRYTGENFSDWYCQNVSALWDAIDLYDGDCSVDRQGDLYQIMFTSNIGGYYRRIDEDTIRIHLNYADYRLGVTRDCELLVAYYDTDGRMLSMTKQSVVLPYGEMFLFAPCPTEFAACRVFTLDAQTMLPTCNEAHLIAVQ